MNLYNMVNKVNPATFFVLPMLGSGHPDNWPRFRDCFVVPNQFKMVNDIPMMVVLDPKSKPNGIYVLLRIGGGNRQSYVHQWDIIKNHPNYENDWDDEFDSTYAHIQYSVPEKWKNDYEKVISGNYASTSKEYKDLLYEVFPKLKNQFDILFSNS